MSTGQVVASIDVTLPGQVVEQRLVLPQGGWLRLELEAQRPGIGMLALTSPVYADGKPAPNGARQEPTSGVPVDYSFP